MVEDTHMDHHQNLSSCPLANRCLHTDLHKHRGCESETHSNTKEFKIDEELPNNSNSLQVFPLAFGL